MRQSQHGVLISACVLVNTFTMTSINDDIGITLMMYVNAGQCFVVSAGNAWYSMSLLISITFCSHYQHSVYMTNILFTLPTFCSHHQHSIYITNILFTSLTFCLHHQHSVHIPNILFTSATFYSSLVTPL